MIADLMLRSGWGERAARSRHLRERAYIVRDYPLSSTLSVPKHN